MAAAVLPAMQNLALDREIMPPSPVSQNSSRHGRSKHGGSLAKGNKTRQRGYSVVDDREALISKALSWVLKRTVEEGEKKEEGETKLVADAEGWVDCDDILEHPQLETLQVTFPELQALVASPASKSRFTIKLTSTPDSADAEDDPSDYSLRLNKNTSNRPDSPTSSKGQELTPLTSESADIPDLIVYETSYPNYPLVLLSGGIKRAGGQAQLQFGSIKVQEDGTELRPTSDADVYIYIDIRAALADNDKITWQRAENGNIVTEGDAAGSIPKKYWKKAVARRADIGVLFEHGEVRKEIPVGLRGKGVKGKRGGGKGKGRGLKELKSRSSEDEESNSD